MSTGCDGDFWKCLSFLPIGKTNSDQKGKIQKDKCSEGLAESYWDFEAWCTKWFSSPEQEWWQPGWLTEKQWSFEKVLTVPLIACL